MESSNVTMKQEDKVKVLKESMTLAQLIDVGKDSIGDKSKILCPNLLVLVCTSNLVSSFSPYQQYQQVYRVEIWNWRTENTQDNIIDQFVLKIRENLRYYPSTSKS